MDKIKKLQDIAEYLKKNMYYIDEYIKKENKDFEFEKYGIKIRIKKNEKVSRQISELFNRIKKLKNKLKRLNEYIREKSKIRIKKKGKWYEKFRWFFTSEGFLVVGGKNAKQNEILIKKYLEKDDLVLHAEVHGSPFVIIKKGQKASMKSIEEAARFCGVFSSAWKIGLHAVDVFYILPNQISKKAPAGEYIKIGSFMVYGKRNYVKNIELYMIIGVKNKEEVVFGFNKDILNKLSSYIIIRPGNMSKEMIARKIEELLNIKKEDIIRFLPSTGFLSDK